MKQSIKIGFSLIITILLIFSAYKFLQTATPKNVYAKTTEAVVNGNTNNNQSHFETLIKKEADTNIPTIIIVEDGILPKKTYITLKKTVGESLKELGLKYDNDDIVYPSLSSPVHDGMTIKIIKVSTICSEKFITVPYTTIYKEDPNSPIGSNTIVKPGINGSILRKKCTLSYNGIVDKNKEVKKEQVLVTMAPQVIARGTKKISTNSSCKYWDNIIDKKTSDKRVRKWLKGLIRCESTCNPLAQNGSSFYGLLQFMPATFKAYGGTDIWNGQEQIDVAIKMYNHYNGNATYIIRQWPCSIKFL